MDAGPYPNGRPRFYMVLNENRFYNFLEDALSKSDVVYEILQMRDNTLEVFREIKKNDEMRYVVDMTKLLSTDIGYLTRFHEDMIGYFSFNTDGDISNICWDKTDISAKLKHLVQYGNELDMHWEQVRHYQGFLSSLRCVMTRDAYYNKDLQHTVDSILYST